MTGLRALALAAAVAAAAPAPAAAAAPAPAAGQREEVLYRAGASAVAVHGFYDHEGLFPVPILNLSVPYTEARLEPGPSSEALGSFLWDPEAAELGTIVCTLSEGRFCDVPEYPFQARAAHPSAGESPDPPTLSLGDPGGPLQVRAAHEAATASVQGASAEASAARLAAVPMTPPQRAAASGLAVALAPAAGRLETTPWLIQVRNAASGSSVASDGDGVAAESRAELHGIQLLGGLVTVSAAEGRAAASLGDGRSVARSRLSGLRVAGLRAELGAGGLVVDDQELGAEELAAVNEALGRALAAVGMDLSPGRERVRRTGDSVTAETFALSLDFRRELLPEQFPEGTRGPDVVRVPVGLASAEVAAAEIVTPDIDRGPPSAPGTGGVAAGVAGVARSPASPVDPPVEGPAAEPRPPILEATPAVAVTDLGVPAAVVVLVALGAAGLAAVLLWFKVNEVLSE